MLNIHSSGHGPGLVLFHGWGFDQTIWHPITCLLKQYFTVYLVDLPGFGYSELVDWVTFKACLLASLPAQFALIGWSMGGLWATRLAIEAPSRITHLVNVASSPCFIKHYQWPGIMPAVLDTFLNQLLANPNKTIEQFINSQVRGCFDKPTIKCPSISGLHAGLEILKYWDLRLQLTQLTMPVCYVFGRLDMLVPYKVLAVMQKNYPYSNFNYVLFKDAAHLPFLSDKQAFITTIKRFLT
jgi:pimeloyl-[acyl-carrier protein] methyl ester esterase